MSGPENIFKALRQSVIKFREKDCQDAAKEVLSQGIDPMTAIKEGLLPGIREVGVLFDTNEYFVPEVLLATDAFYLALDVLRPYIPRETSTEKKISIVLGSVQGDVHDIGKNLVKIMFEIHGWNVYDLGRDVPLERFVEKQLETQSDIIAMSAMMTTTMMGMKKVIAMVRQENPSCRVLIGGASVTREIADVFGADGYARSSGVAVAEVLRMIE